MTRNIQVLDRVALMGPNLHSHQPCIKWKIDIGALEERPSNVIPGFVDRLMAVIPSLIEHRCSEGVRGGFKTRLDLGTWMGHVMEHVALELQNLVGSRVGFGRARSAREHGVYYVIYQCEERETGIAAGELALDLIEHLVEEKDFPFVEKLAELRALHEKCVLDPWTQEVVAAAKKRRIPVLRIDESDQVLLGQGELAKRLESATVSTYSADEVIEMLFPSGAPSRIPVVTVTGTNGKTTTARLLGHIAHVAGYHVGLATTDGIYIRNNNTLKGDLTGPQSAATVLQDSAVNFAVLETARGGILRAGLGYDWSDVAIVTNIAEDHLGLRGVNTIEDLARVKAVTVERVFPSGYAVLNAEDAMTPLFREHADCNIALFGLDPASEDFRAHVDSGGLGVTVEDDAIVVCQGDARTSIATLGEVPITFEGRAKFNVANVLAAVAAAWAMRLRIDSIRSALRTFVPSVDQTPGRTNFIEFDGFTVVIDYAHNPHGVSAMADFVRTLDRKRSVATIAVPGDRRDEDIEAVATIAASAFDEVILREDYHPRGRKRGEVAAIMHAAMLHAGFDESLIHVCTDELGALELGLQICREGDLLLYFADKVDEATEFLERKRMEKAGK